MQIPRRVSLRKGSLKSLLRVMEGAVGLFLGSTPKIPRAMVARAVNIPGIRKTPLHPKS
jgi:hypothetical protein